LEPRLRRAGHFEVPQTNRRIGCGTREPDIVPGEFSDASVVIVGPSGNLSAVLFCEKEGFNPLFKAMDLANRYDLLIISTKGVSVTAARRLIDSVCGDKKLPLFVLHEFDVAGFVILGTRQRDTRHYQFSSAVEVVDLGLRLADIVGLERKLAGATRTAAMRCPIGLLKQVVAGDHLFDAIVLQLALDHLDQGIAAHRVKLNALKR
jgi:hypothetical protein